MHFKNEAYRFLKTTIVKLNPFQSILQVCPPVLSFVFVVLSIPSESVLSRYVNHSTWCSDT